MSDAFIAWHCGAQRGQVSATCWSEAPSAGQSLVHVSKHLIWGEQEWGQKWLCWRVILRIKWECRRKHLSSTSLLLRFCPFTAWVSVWLGFFYVSVSAEIWVTDDRFEWWPQYLQLSEHNMKFNVALKGCKKTRPKQFLVVSLKKYLRLSSEVEEPSNYLSVIFLKMLWYHGDELLIKLQSNGESF